jgi:hypothetical protein
LRVRIYFPIVVVDGLLIIRGRKSDCVQWVMIGGRRGEEADYYAEGSHLWNVSARNERRGKEAEGVELWTRR